MTALAQKLIPKGYLPAFFYSHWLWHIPYASIPIEKATPSWLNAHYLVNLLQFVYRYYFSFGSGGTAIRETIGHKVDWRRFDRGS